MKKIIYLIIIVFTAFSCSVDVNRDKVSEDVSGERTLHQFMYACLGNSDCNGSIFPYHKSSTEVQRQTIASKKTNYCGNNCNREYWHKVKYVDKITTLRCYECNADFDQKEVIEKQCIGDPNEGKFIKSHGVPVCDEHSCTRYDMTMLIKEDTSPSFIIPGEATCTGRCNPYCKFDDGRRHFIVRKFQNIQNYRCTGRLIYTFEGENYNFACRNTRYSYDVHHIVCYEE